MTQNIDWPIKDKKYQRKTLVIRISVYEKVVITGGIGFIGSSCIRPFLSLGFEVHNFDLYFHIEDQIFLSQS